MFKQNRIKVEEIKFKQYLFIYRFIVVKLNKISRNQKPVNSKFNN